MGAAKSKAAQKAIKADGIENVHKAVALEESNKRLPKQANQFKKNLEQQLRQKMERKEDYLREKRKQVDDLLENKKQDMKKKDKKALDKLEKKQGKDLKEIVGYNQTQQELDQFERQTKETFDEELRRLKEDIDSEVQNIKSKNENQKPSLPALTKLGNDKKAKVLKDLGDDKQLKDRVAQEEGNNLSDLQKIFPLDEVYENRFEQKVPNKDADKIVKDFEHNLDSVTKFKPGCW